MAIRRKIKKKQTRRQQARVPFPVLLAHVLVLVAVLGLSYMWLCARCDALGRDIKAKERELSTARKELANEQERWFTLTSPRNLRAAIERYGLGMTMPEDARVVRMGLWDTRRRTAMARQRD